MDLEDSAVFPVNRLGLTLTWCNLSVHVKQRSDKSTFWKQKYERCQILKNVCGIARSGSLLAVMGASGSGKTTLLATISQRFKGDITGAVKVNGQDVNQECMANMSGYVPQQDLSIDSLSVREHMEFMASLKMDRRIRMSHRQRLVNSLLLGLGLSTCEETKLSALSSGERKRLSLAVQLLTDPPFLFCDEPTTGLDSFSATVVMETLQQVAASGRAVICSIHQPTSGIFDMFSHVLLLAQGRLAFYGDVHGAAKYFESFGLICPQTYNQAEFFVKQLAIVPGQEEDSQYRIDVVCKNFSDSSYGQELTEVLTVLKGTTNSSFASSFTNSYTNSVNEYKSYVSENIETSTYSYNTILKPTNFMQLYWLTWRSFVDIRQHAAEISLQFFLYMCVGILISTPYINLVLEEQSGVQDMQGLLYLTVAETVFTYAYSVFHTFPAEIPILLREIGNGLYKPGPYYVSKMISLVPRAVIGPFIFCGIVYSVVSLQGGISGFLLFCIPVILSAISATAYGSLLSASFQCTSTASLLSVPIDFVSLTFSGIFLQLNNLPVYLSWICYTSQFFYALEAISILQWYEVRHINCTPKPDFPCISDGLGVLDKYGYHNSNFFIDISGLVLIYCFCHAVGFLSIWKRSKSIPIY